MVLGFFLVRPIALPPASGAEECGGEGEIENDGDAGEQAGLLHRDEFGDLHSSQDP